MLPFERLQNLKKRIQEIHGLLAGSEIAKDPQKIQHLGRELARIEPIVNMFDDYLKLEKEFAEADQLVKSTKGQPDLIALYEEEKKTLIDKKNQLQTAIEDCLLGEDEADNDKNIIVEIRAGTGGEEASLFVRDLFRMYSKYATDNGFQIEVMSTNPTGKGGFKEIIFSVGGNRVYSAFKYESGIHRVQRVPETEASGRIHTSASTVAVLPEADEVEVEIKPEDLRIDVCRAGGPGGQGVNTTDSAVQILHIPSGIQIRCQDERSQLKNKAKGLRILRARLFQLKQESQDKAISEARKLQVGSGDRSGKIRTYNFPDNRVTDHRIGLTLHNLDDILGGHLSELISALKQYERMKKLTDESKHS